MFCNNLWWGWGNNCIQYLLNNYSINHLDLKLKDAVLYVLIIIVFIDGEFYGNNT